MRPPTIVNQPPIHLIPPDNTSATDSEHKLERVLSATGQRLKPTNKVSTLRKLSEFEPYTPSPIDRDDFLEDEPLFATELSAFGASLTIYQFSSEHLANLNRHDIVADHYGCTRADIAMGERAKPLTRGQRFKRFVDWATIEEERSNRCVQKQAQREEEREAKQQARDAEWQRELATWPPFVPRNPIDPSEVVARDAEWFKQQPQGSLFYNPTTCKHNLNVEDCRACSPLPIDALTNAIICFHHNLRSFTFSTGQCIKMCPDCTNFDARRKGTLERVPKLANAKTQHAVQRWEERLEAQGLSVIALLPRKQTKRDLAAIEHAQATDGRASTAKSDYRASQIRKEVKTYTEAQRNCEGCGVLFVPNHASRTHCSDNCRKQHFKKKKQGRPILHTLTMPRALRNFCPQCSAYEPLHHDCQGNALEQNIKLRKQEEARRLRESNLTLSNPNELAPSRILQSKGGYGNN